MAMGEGFREGLRIGKVFEAARVEEATQKNMAPATATEPDPLDRFFDYSHLPPHLREVSQLFHDLAAHLIKMLPHTAERTVALRKLLEAKDCAVRSLL
jgi:hypothetical protein